MVDRGACWDCPRPDGKFTRDAEDHVDSATAVRRPAGLLVLAFLPETLTIVDGFLAWDGLNNDTVAGGRSMGQTRKICGIVVAMDIG